MQGDVNVVGSRPHITCIKRKRELRARPGDYDQEKLIKHCGWPSENTRKPRITFYNGG